MARRRIILKDHLAKLEDRGVDFEAPDGTVFFIPPPELWPDEANTAVGLNAQAVAVMGEEQYAAFKAAGGNARIVNDELEKMLGTTVPET